MKCQFDLSQKRSDSHKFAIQVCGSGETPRNTTRAFSPTRKTQQGTAGANQKTDLLPSHARVRNKRGQTNYLLESIHRRRAETNMHAGGLKTDTNRPRPTQMHRPASTRVACDPASAKRMHRAARTAPCAACTQRYHPASCRLTHPHSDLESVVALSKRRSRSSYRTTCRKNAHTRNSPAQHACMRTSTIPSIRIVFPAREEELRIAAELGKPTFDGHVIARHVLLSATATTGWSGSARPSKTTPSSSWLSASRRQREASSLLLLAARLAERVARAAIAAKLVHAVHAENAQ